MYQPGKLFKCWLIGCFILLYSCQPGKSPLLEKAMQIEYASTDSIFFYLQQIEQPDKLLPQERGDYYLLVYKATLWKTGKPNDSLLYIAIENYERNKQHSRLMKAHIEQSASYLYHNLPDSTLLITDKLLQEKSSLNDTLKIQLYGLRRAAFARKQAYTKALAMADSAREIVRYSKDTLSYFSLTQAYLNLIEMNDEHDRYIEEYHQLINTVADSPRFSYLKYSALKNLQNNSLKRGEFDRALYYLREMSQQQRSREEIPHFLLLRGKTFAAINQTDSALYYYQQAAISSSDYIAMEANALLFQLINSKEYPEQAFYIKQKEYTVRDNILSTINTEIQKREYKEIKLQNELYQLHLIQQKKELWMMGLATALLGIGFIAFFFYQREKKRRLQRENQLLYKETELSNLREKESWLRGKEAELREALFRRFSFFQKLPSLHTSNDETEANPNYKIAITATEWAEIISVVNDAFDNFVVRLRQAYPQLADKEIGFCCLVKINVNIQDLSNIYCVSKAAITKRKYRIKTEKLGITDENISLDSFLKGF